MTEVWGPAVYDKTKVVFGFPSPGVAGAMIDAQAMVVAEMKNRGLGNKTSFDDAYHVEAYDDQVRVWFEYEKSVSQPEVVYRSNPGSATGQVATIVVPVLGIAPDHLSDASRWDDVAKTVRECWGNDTHRDAVVALLSNVAEALRNQ